VWECAYEQWHRLLFARYLAENGLLRHPVYEAPVTLAECEELAEELGEPDGWSVAARFASEILPGIFRLDDPAVQIRLAAEHRVALEQIVAGVPGEVFLADDSLGWVYQYWQSERKDQVNASEVKIGGADLSPVTQLFTENYMVRFLLENSLGAWWAARRPDSPLIKEFVYLRFDEDGQPAAGTFDGWPDTVADVTVMDPCCGSGHFLVEAFGMLWRMRVEEEGLDPVAAQDAVLRDNLFGLELDPRCVQMALFAVALTAWKQGGGWRLLPTPNIACSGIPAKAPLEEWTALANGDQRVERTVERLHALFKDADTLGSLIDPRRAAEMANAAGVQRSFDDIEFDEVAPLLEKATARESDDPVVAVLDAGVSSAVKSAHLLQRSYWLVATNVPFLARRKQGSTLIDYCSRFLAPTELALVFFERLLSLATRGGMTAMVAPNKWRYQRTYKALRTHILHSAGIGLIADLGAGAFSAQLWDFNVDLLIVGSGRPESEASYAAINASSGPTPEATDMNLRSVPCARLSQAVQASNPDERILVERLTATGPLLSELATAVQGTATGDDPRYRRTFWEVGNSGNKWQFLQSSVGKTAMYGGRSDVVDLPGAEQGGRGRIQGQKAWTRKGISVSAMAALPAALYTGDAFDMNATVLIPNSPQDISALWAFVSSPNFVESVRRIEPKLNVTTATATKVAFDVERWRRAAAEEFPEGLPEPWSDDPTQWLFEGRPEMATEPLQVGVGRLVGYRWPEQPEVDGLDGHADVDGIVCLPAVGGEPPAADRLSSLLADAYGGEWSLGLAGKLLEQAGSKKKSLAEWLRDDSFKHHCRVFVNRPFVWHIWDGRKDGFAVLVNYHRLDRAGLEKLTYTYLGDWIERQRAGAADEVAGADLRLAAALELRGKLEAILEGEPPFDIYVRWKSLAEQPIGWDPDLDDGVRLNIRPFVEAGVLRSKVSVHWRKDRGKNPDGSERHNDLHYTKAEKRQARKEAGMA
jgi:hypothetical protein